MILQKYAADQWNLFKYLILQVISKCNFTMLTYFEHKIKALYVYFYMDICQSKEFLNNNIQKYFLKINNMISQKSTAVQSNLFKYLISILICVRLRGEKNWFITLSFLSSHSFFTHFVIKNNSLDQLKLKYAYVLISAELTESMKSWQKKLVVLLTFQRRIKYFSLYSAIFKRLIFSLFSIVIICATQRRVYCNSFFMHVDLIEEIIRSSRTKFKENKFADNLEI